MTAAALRVVAIHQPNFFPWLGYFDKLARCDAFVLLDTVQFPKKGGTWINRVKVLIDGEARWLTAPVNRAYHGYQDIRSMTFDESRPWRNSILATIRAAYSRAPFFAEAIELLAPLILNPEPRIAQYNEHSIRSLSQVFDIDMSKICAASSLQAQGVSNELLIATTLELGGTGYMCGGGSDGYQDDELFSQAGLKVIYQNFQHPKYPQAHGGDFVAGLSCIDALMNVGVAGTRRLLQPLS